MTFLRNIDHSQTYKKIDCNVACFTIIGDEKSMRKNSEQRSMNKYLSAICHFHQFLNGIVQKIKRE